MPFFAAPFRINPRNRLMINDYEEQLVAMADSYAQQTSEEFNVSLDFSPESLAVIDELITGMKFSDANLDSVITNIGIYTGEVLRRNLGGRWVEDEQFGVHLCDVGEANVMSQPLKWLKDRFEKGPGASVREKYRAVLDHLEGGTRIPEGGVAYVTRPRTGTGEGPQLDAVLMQAPAIIFYLIAAADGDVETEEWERFLEMMSDYHAEKSELFERAVVAMNPRLNQYFAYISSPDFDADELLDELRRVLDEKYADEAPAFKRALLDLAREIAEAAGGFLGFGEKVSEEEHEVLRRITRALGI